MAIDWNFLLQVEGKENKPYVPMRGGKAVQQSGVTVGTGVDLGAQSEAKLRRLGVSDEIIEKLKPFFGKKQDKAIKALENNPDVILEDDEVLELDRAIKSYTLRQVKSWYNKDNKLGQDWGDLSDRQQTVVLSVFYNHGLDGAPNFKRQIEEGDWSAAIDNLRNFYSSPTNELHSRRVKEAQYLAGLSGSQVDGIDGPQTAQAVENFKNTVGVMTPDQPTPQQPVVDPLTFTDNFMAMFEEMLNTRQRASQEVSEPVTADTEVRLGESEDAAAQRGEVSQFTEAEEALINAAVSTPVEDKPAEEEIEWTLAEQNLLERASGTVETAPPVYAEPREGIDDSKDPIYGIF